MAPKQETPSHHHPKMSKPNGIRKKIKKPLHVPELPNEVWLNVFEHLDYFTLKMCTMVSKTFKSLTEHPILDEKLFRVGPTPGNATIQVDKVNLHPAFDAIAYNCSSDIRDVVFSKYDLPHYPGPEDEQWDLETTSAAKEYATSPAVPFIRLQIHSYPLFETRNKHGVTVLQVMRAVCRFFGKTARRSPYPFPMNRIYKDKQVATYQEFMQADGCEQWIGWTSKDLDTKGRLLLTMDDIFGEFMGGCVCGECW